eukprot:scaffold503_cov365-Prasinococcus_capsulatus_cf.AAC.3
MCRSQSKTASCTWGIRGALPAFAQVYAGRRSPPCFSGQSVGPNTWPTSAVKGAPHAKQCEANARFWSFGSLVGWICIQVRIAPTRVEKAVGKGNCTMTFEAYLCQWREGEQMVV